MRPVVIHAPATHPVTIREMPAAKPDRAAFRAPFSPDRIGAFDWDSLRAAALFAALGVDQETANENGWWLEEHDDGRWAVLHESETRYAIEVPS